MTTQNVLLKIDNPVLHRLIEEQLSMVKTITLDASLPPHLMIVQQGSVIPDHLNTIPVLEIPKGAVRLGEMIDKIGYLLSGRESHIEDENENIDLGEFTLFPSENILTHIESGDDIRLTDKERLLLRFLFEARETGIPRKDLLKAVWGYADDAETHTLETHIYRLRQKLEIYNAQNLIKVFEGVYKIDLKKH
ncbi:MAG: hypothetical protein A3B66_03015 [Alphaproteobacteria bacterium RIFCSPHIGHO2_02_FULL_46_13]|nr:MAG: hypothetical protein A3B66_03015 [Alphaproteobacteria bacterium RIFCSPHIGHO2_02_FULL_46_13]